MAKPKLAIPKEWRHFANQYGADRAYWYVPKGFAVTADSLRLRLNVLKEFEGGTAWRDCQADYVQRLNDENISVAASEWSEGGAPLARMLKQEYYISKGDIAAAIATKKRITKSVKELSEFQDMIVSEKAVEGGVIVARKIDDKLKAARDAHDTRVHLIEFEMKIGAAAV
jgi:hypothetical protein